MHISSGFDSGNIRVLAADTVDNIRLEIQTDNQSDFYQWFHYRLTGARNQPCVMRIENAGGAAFAGGWKDYRAVASYDRRNWFRVDTAFDGEVLSIRHRPEHDSAYYAYFAPYSTEQHRDLIARAGLSDVVSTRVLGQTLDGQDLDLLEITGANNGKDKLNCWLIARQHPGETMAEWWMEGFLDKLLDDKDATSRALLDRCRFFVVPNMNPDGSRRGHLRTNAVGANLNREWLEPSMERSPEVYLVRAAMHETGVDFCFDVHGDEALPWNFVAGFEAIPSRTDHQMDLLGAYKAALLKRSPDFQTKHGYPAGKPGTATLKMCTDYVAETFGCLAMTLEMPFKDNADNPDAEFGWSPERCKTLAGACTEALNDIVDQLRIR